MHRWIKMEKLKSNNLDGGGKTHKMHTAASSSGPTRKKNHNNKGGQSLINLTDDLPTVVRDIKVQMC